MGKTKHYRATINLLRPFFTNRPDDFKIKILDGYVGMKNNSYIYWDGKNFTRLEQLDDVTGLKVFIYTEDNRFILEEFLIAENRTQENEWEFGPYNINTEDGEAIGAVGVIHDTISDNHMVVYLASDGTTSPITLWAEGSSEEKELAITDLKNMSGVILELINKLQSNEKN